MAMCELRRRNYEKRCIRFLWSDSSMQLGHDILWAQIHEIPVDSLVPVFKAFVDLSLHTQAFVRSRSETAQRAGAQDVQPGHQSTEELPMQDVWRPFLRKLLLIKEHIYTPGVMASGHRSLTHKVETLLYSFCHHMVAGMYH